MTFLKEIKHEIIHKNFTPTQLDNILESFGCCDIFDEVSASDFFELDGNKGAMVWTKQLPDNEYENIYVEYSLNKSMLNKVTKLLEQKQKDSYELKDNEFFTGSYFIEQHKKFDSIKFYIDDVYIV